MNVLELLDRLDAADIIIGVKSTATGPALCTDAPSGAITAELGAEIRLHKEMLIAIVSGRNTGHAPGACTICGRVSMVNTSTSAGKPVKAWPKCRYSSACTTAAHRDDPGRHVPRQVDIARTTPVAPVPEARPPAKTSHRRLLGPYPKWPTGTCHRCNTPNAADSTCPNPDCTPF